jgi:hypothetical protein
MISTFSLASIPPPTPAETADAKQSSKIMAKRPDLFTDAPSLIPYYSLDFSYPSIITS